MTIDRDDPERDSSAADARLNGPALHAADDELTLWAISFIGSSLMTDGLSPAEVYCIVRDSVHQCRAFQRNVNNPLLFLVDHITRRARRYMERRGMTPPSIAEQETPHIRDIIRTNEAVDSLTGNARRAVYLLFYENKSYEEIADELDVHVRYVRRLLQGAVEQLRRWRPRA